jgi:hypothetical protein
MKHSGDFVAAGYVYFGQWLNIEDDFLPDPSTPETIFMDKEVIEKLPRECEILKDILLNLPEELFLISGKAKKTAFRRIIKAKTGWNDIRINRVEERLKTSLKNY